MEIDRVVGCLTRQVTNLRLRVVSAITRHAGVKGDWLPGLEHFVGCRDVGEADVKIPAVQRAEMPHGIECEMNLNSSYKNSFL